MSDPYYYGYSMASQDNNGWDQSFSGLSPISPILANNASDVNPNGDMFAPIPFPMASADWPQQAPPPAMPATDAFAPPPFVVPYPTLNATVQSSMPSSSLVPSYPSQVSSPDPSSQGCSFWPSAPSSTTSHSYSPSQPPSDAGCAYPLATSSSIGHATNVCDPSPPPSPGSNSSQILPGASSSSLATTSPPPVVEINVNYDHKTNRGPHNPPVAASKHRYCSPSCGCRPSYGRPHRPPKEESTCCIIS